MNSVLGMAIIGSATDVCNLKGVSVKKIRVSLCDSVVFGVKCVIILTE